jgi:hypothetical protein
MLVFEDPFDNRIRHVLRRVHYHAKFNTKKYFASAYIIALFLDKLIVTKQIRQFPAFMKRETKLPPLKPTILFYLIHLNATSLLNRI